MSLAWLEYIVILFNNYVFRFITELANLFFGVAL